MKCWHTTAALDWLQTILQERFGHTFALQLKHDECRISLYLPGDTRCITLALDSATYCRADSHLPCAQWNASAEGWPTALPGALPAPGATALPVPLISTTDKGWHIGYDIFGLTYWMLARQEEIRRTDLDNHGRFPAIASHAYQHGYLERPIVDEWLHVLGKVIDLTWPGIELTRHQFSMKVSHDVDSPSMYAFKSWTTIVRMMAGHALKRHDWRAFCTAPLVKLASTKTLHPADPFNTFEWLMDVSEAHNLTSAFYFICGRTSNMDADYEPEHPVIRALMRRIYGRGHEIGLHPSYGTYQKPELIAQEAHRLRTVLAEENIQQSAIGGRMHYLRWEQATTLQAWNDAGMTYDSTLGYADRPGFRCGTCFEYPAYNPKNNQSLKIRIRPLIAMECSVIDSVYLGLSQPELAKDKFINLKKHCQALKGTFTVLWHNSYLLQNEIYKNLYKDILN